MLCSSSSDSDSDSESSSLRTRVKTTLGELERGEVDNSVSDICGKLDWEMSSDAQPTKRMHNKKDIITIFFIAD